VRVSFGMHAAFQSCSGSYKHMSDCMVYTYSPALSFLHSRLCARVCSAFMLWPAVEISYLQHLHLYLTYCTSLIAGVLLLPAAVVCM
jgi:hypothetical protein